MKIGKEYQMNPYRNRWPAAAADLGLNADQVVSRVFELTARAADAFADAAKATKTAAVDSDLPARLTDLVAERASRCAQLCEIT
jgi:serine/threonine-protein kinase HipA